MTKEDTVRRAVLGAAAAAVLGAALWSAGPAGASSSTAGRAGTDNIDWTIQNLPQPLPEDAGLSDVSCAADGACMIVGRYQASKTYEGPLSYLETAGSWVRKTVPEPNPGSVLYADSCTSAKSCLAVGLNGKDKPFSVSWNGTRWADHTMPVPPSASYASILDVSCVTPTACTAIGDWFSSPGANEGLAEQWNGTRWAILPSAGLDGDQPDTISCWSAKGCMAGGLNGSEDALAAKWNGSTWTSYTIPQPSGANGGQVEDLSCSSATACTAVGFYFVESGNDQLIARWDGTSWASQSPPPAANLPGVACPTATSCTATGTGDTYAPFAYGWSPSQGWVFQAEEPPLGSIDATTAEVSCVTATNCTAVGYYTDNTQGTPQNVLVEHE
jgi:hypothetical protein